MSRLYPGWGSGDKPLELVHRCFSFECVQKATEFENGDKIILPAAALKEVSRLKLPFPLYFRVAPTKGMKARKAEEAAASKGKPVKPVIKAGQYCSVLEFSAPENVAYLPSWMMRNIKVKEGGMVHITSAFNLEKGTFCKLQPQSEAFMNILQELGPKLFLENTLRHYSVLSKGERIDISHNNQKFTVKVIEARPSDVVSILGNVDLEVEFASPPIGIGASDSKEDLGMPASGDASPAMTPAQQEEEMIRRAMAMSLNESTAPAPSEEDQGWATSVSPPQGVTRSSSYEDTSAAASESVTVDASDKPSVSLSAPSGYSATGPGYSLKTKSPMNTVGKTQCDNCLRYIPSANFHMHTVHCFRSISLCRVCGEPVKRTELEQHQQTHQVVTCACGDTMEAGVLAEHQATTCTVRPVQCRFCDESIPLPEKAVHEDECGRRQFACATCNQMVDLRELVENTHQGHCRPKCTFCHQFVAAAHLADHHRLECPARMVTCEFCKLGNIAASQITKHQEYCGNRTEQCEVCQRYIRLRDMGMHVESLCAFPINAGSPAVTGSAGSPYSDPDSPFDEFSLPSHGAYERPVSPSRAVDQTLRDLDAGRMEREEALDVELIERVKAMSVSDALVASSLHEATKRAQAFLGSVNADTSVSSSSSVARSSSNRKSTTDLGSKKTSGSSKAGSASPSEKRSSFSKPTASTKSAQSASSVRRSPPSASSSSTTGAAPSLKSKTPSKSKPSSSKAGTTSSAVPRANSGSFPCPHCAHRCADYEDLQMHVFTTCKQSGYTASSPTPAKTERKSPVDDAAEDDDEATFEQRTRVGNAFAVLNSEDAASLAPHATKPLSKKPSSSAAAVRKPATEKKTAGASAKRSTSSSSLSVKGVSSSRSDLSISEEKGSRRSSATATKKPSAKRSSASTKSSTTTPSRKV